MRERTILNETMIAADFRAAWKGRVTMIRRTAISGATWRTTPLALTAWLAIASFALACPFCSAPSLTLTEQATQSDVVVLAGWKSGSKGSATDANQDATTTFEIREVLKGPFKKGDTVTLAGYQPAEQGELFLLTGINTELVQWDIPTAFTETAFDYLKNSPAPSTPDGEKVAPRKRLPYFVKNLENADEVIANDAYGEFANSPYDEIVAIKEHLDRDILREWVIDPETPPSRLGLYGLLLGLSGNDEDAKAMEELIAKPTNDFRIGLDGVMSGYLLIREEPGLELVSELKLENEYTVDRSGKVVTDENGDKIPVPFSETYAAMQAVRFMWDYGNGQIDADALRKTMRVLLNRPELADLAIADLARWEDWSIMKRLFDLYDEEAYQIPGIKRSIIRYFDAAMKNKPEAKDGESEVVPEHAKQAAEYYAELKKKDPDMVKSVEQFLILVQ